MSEKAAYAPELERLGAVGIAIHQNTHTGRWLATDQRKRAVFVAENFRAALDQALAWEAASLPAAQPLRRAS